MSTLARPLKWPPVFPLEKGLVLWLPFDERSGARALDRSGKRNHGRLYGPTWVAGRRGSALSFDGVNDYLEVGDAVELRLLPPLTLMVWIYPRTTPRANNDVIQKAYDYSMNVQSSREVLLFNYNDALAASDWLLSVSLVSLNTWSHIVGVWEGVNENFTYKIYINGVLDISKSSTFTCQQTTNPLRIGRYSSDREFDGVIDEVRIYNRALNAAEVKRLYESEISLVRH